MVELILLFRALVTQLMEPKTSDILTTQDVTSSQQVINPGTNKNAKQRGGVMERLIEKVILILCTSKE